MAKKRNYVSHIGGIGLGLSILFFALWFITNRFGFTRAPIEFDMAMNTYYVLIISNISLYTNVYLLCHFALGGVCRRDSLIIVGYVASGYLLTPFFNTEYSLLHTTLLPFVLILICAALNRQNILIAAIWLVIIFLITLALQLFLIIVHVGMIPFVNVPVSNGVNFGATLAVNFDQDLFLAFACAMKAGFYPKMKHGRMLNAMFPITVEAPGKGDSERSIITRLVPAVVISVVCIAIGGFTAISVIISYVAFASGIGRQWRSESAVYNTIVYLIVLSAACVIATFFYYPLLMPVACGLLAAYFLYRIGLENESAVDTNEIINNAAPAMIVPSDGEPEPASELQNEPFSRDELASFSFKDCNSDVLKYLVETSGINNLYAELLIAKYCENLSGGEMEVRFQSVGVARTRQRHLQKARSEILQFRDSLLEKQKQQFYAAFPYETDKTP